MKELPLTFEEFSSIIRNNQNTRVSTLKFLTVYGYTVINNLI